MNNKDLFIRRNSVELDTVGTWISNASSYIITQQIEYSNYEMVNVLSSQMITILNPLVQTTIDSFQKLTYQMT